jgi:hypothetical protein
VVVVTSKLGRLARLHWTTSVCWWTNSAVLLTDLTGFPAALDRSVRLALRDQQV